MAETLGTLCDKLTVVKLKQWHSDNQAKSASLAQQETQLKVEIDEFVALAVSGGIPAGRLTFAANKIFKNEGNKVAEVVGGIGNVMSQLAEVNCKIWHEQEKVYEFEKVLPSEKETARSMMFSSSRTLPG